MQRTLEHLLNRGKELEIYLGISPALVHETEEQVLPLIITQCEHENQIEEEST